jgi:hypothetical protein
MNAGQSNAGRSNDPQWDLAIEIAAKLWIDGQFVAELHPLPAQRLVDLQWAARQAGRVLGGRATVQTSHSRDAKDPTITVTVTYVDSTGQGLKRAEEGLEALMRQVLDAQSER